MPVTNPPPYRVPQAFMQDTELFNYFTELHTFLRLLWTDINRGDFASLSLNQGVSGTADSAADTIYTATGVVASVDALTAYNSHSGAVTVYLYILADGVAATSVDPVATQSIAAGASASITDILGQVVPLNGTIAAYASTGSVISITASGLERS